VALVHPGEAVAMSEWNHVHVEGQRTLHLVRRDAARTSCGLPLDDVCWCPSVRDEPLDRPVCPHCMWTERRRAGRGL
jgi:hypothetical protein